MARRGLRMIPWLGAAALAGMALAAPARAAEPTAAQLAQALSDYDGQGAVLPDDLRAIACEGSAEEPTEYNCRWQQHRGREWSGYSTWLALEADRWTVIEDPLPEPEGRNPQLEKDAAPE